MAKLLIDARESGTSTGRYIDKLVEHLHALKPQFEVVVLTKTPRIEYIKQIAPNFEVVESNYKEFTFAEQLGFAWQLYSLKADLVHFTMTQQPLLYFKKNVTTVHDLTTARFRNPTKNWLVYKIKQWVYRGLIIWVAHKSRRLIVPTQYVKTDLSKFAHINKDKIVVTYESAEEFGESDEPIPFFEGKQYIMFNGRPLPHKNLRRLIQALALLGQKYPNLYLMIAGKKDASFNSYVNLANELKVSDKVVLTDWITDGQLKWAMANTVAYIYPSLSEGFGLPPLEAMLHGAPVAASNTSCIPEVLGDTAQYFNPLSVEDMAAKIGDILDSPKLREEFIRKGHEQVKKYSWDKMSVQTLEIYNKILKT
jgi:glycosyltransferase involved in cell wall biosynthesis